MNRLIETACVLVLIFTLSTIGANAFANRQERQPSVVDDIEVNTQYRGDEPEYKHGSHCIDERTF